MKYKYSYKTPPNFSDIVMFSDGDFLTGLYFIGSKSLPLQIHDITQKPLPIFNCAVNWLDIYFSGRVPNFTPKYKLENLTKFTKEVLSFVSLIPYGKTTTYGEIASNIALKRSIKKMSARAVGSAVGRNPLCVILPCHRVVGAKGSTVGYSGGIKNKTALLNLEKDGING